MLLFSGVSSISPRLSQSAAPKAEASAPAEASLMPTGVEEQDDLCSPVWWWAFVQGCDGVYSVCCLLPLQFFLGNLLPYSHPSSHLPIGIIPMIFPIIPVRGSRHLSKMVFALLLRADPPTWLEPTLTSGNAWITSPNTALPANSVSECPSPSQRR